MRDEQLTAEIRDSSYNAVKNRTVRVEITADADREADFQAIREAVREVLDR